MQMSPNIDDWPEITREVGEDTRRVNLNTLQPKDVLEWRPG